MSFLFGLVFPRGRALKKELFFWTSSGMFSGLVTRSVLDHVWEPLVPSFYGFLKTRPVAGERSYRNIWFSRIVIGEHPITSGPNYYTKKTDTSDSWSLSILQGLELTDEKDKQTPPTAAAPVSPKPRIGRRNKQTPLTAGAPVSLNPQQ